MALDVVGIAPLNGWKQLGASHWTVLEQHRFSEGSAGELLHFTNDELRAVVPPEGWDDYLRAWPEAADLVGQLRRPAQAPAPAETADAPAEIPGT
jgi:hypothetical protein